MTQDIILIETDEITTILTSRGDTFVREYTLKDPELVPIDLTGSVIKFSIKKELSETTPLISVSASIPTPVNGSATVTIPSETMQQLTFIGLYYYDLQWTDSSGVVKTLKRGPFYNLYDVTTPVTP